MKISTKYIEFAIMLIIFNITDVVNSRFLTRIASKSKFIMNLDKMFSFPFLEKKTQNEVSKPKIIKSNTIIKYFNNWNRRDFNNALECFTEDCVYEDTLYPKIFRGKNELNSHFLNIASSLPISFQFVIDKISEDSNTGNVGIQWHVESNNMTLPFARGCSMYTIDDNGYISNGFDVPEPVLKSGSISLFILKLAKNLITDNSRIIPLVGWIFYCWLLFFSTIAPGPNALSLDIHTWNEVKDLSLNFWFVLPIISPDIAPIQHPILESIFNLVLVWSGLFVGFIIDGKNEFINHKNKMLTTIIGMQFLTNALFLPYLVTRDFENDKISIPAIDSNNNNNNNNALTNIEKIGESKLLPILLGSIGILSIYWGIYGRYDLYGDLSTRLSSFYDILKNDRLSFSFLIDLIYYAYFQNWLVDDDLKRRYINNINNNNNNNNSISNNNLKAISSIPLIGLIAYLLLRPTLSSNKTE